MDIEEKDYERYIRRIDQIDRVLREPIESLVDLAIIGLGKGQRSGVRRTLFIPPSIREDQQVRGETQLNTALCCSTLQRVWFHRRRFPKLGSKLEQVEASLKRGQPSDSTVPELLAEPFLLAAPEGAGLEDYVAIVGNPDSGPFDPYTASQVFWVLLNAGERNAHTATGFFSFFLICWSLGRQLPEPGGAAAGQSPQTAYVTAKCLAPLFSLIATCRRRAALLEDISRLLKGLVSLMSHPDRARRGQWLPLRLDELSGKLYDLSEIAISREGFRACAKEIGEVADRLQVRSNTTDAWAAVVASLVRSFRELGRLGNEGLSEARHVIRKLLPELVKALKEEDEAKRAKKLGAIGRALEPPLYRTTDQTRRYWDDLAASAEAAYVVCQSAFAALQAVSRRCSKLAEVAAEDLIKRPQRLRQVPQTLLKIFSELAVANCAVAGKFEQVTRKAGQWCESVLTREIAHASAKHLTEFDPAELLSALFVTVSTRRVDSSLQVSDAVGKAILVGVREDGSWVPGQPFFVQGDLGLWAPTSDIVWMLSSTVARYPEVCAADEALGAYLDWLERTRKTLRYEGEEGRPGLQRVTGWISERNLREKRIDVWATTFAVNALLGIRELMEYRLWELCERRFTVLNPALPLSEIDAVDLGATHVYRLHRRLARMVRQSGSSDEFKDAEYSLVLHGPPGSSKTAITEALAAEMWRSSSSSMGRRARLIRITPADFTRKGEDRLDAEARLIFNILGRVRGVTVLFDEIDDLLRMRDGRGEASFFRLVVPAMLNRLQDLRDACPKQEICFVLATNYVDRIEPALLRKGRIDGAIALVYPDRESRRCTLGKHVERLRKRGQEEEWAGWATKVLAGELGTKRIADTDYWPWKAFDTLCKETAGELKRVWHEGLDAQRDARARERIDWALARGKAGVATGLYGRQRRARLSASAELREELLQYSLAGAEDLASLLNVLFANVRFGSTNHNGDRRGATSLPDALSNREEAVELLQGILGNNVRGRLCEIAAIRGWSAVDLAIVSEGEPPSNDLGS